MELLSTRGETMPTGDAAGRGRSGGQRDAADGHYREYPIIEESAMPAQEPPQDASTPPDLHCQDVTDILIDYVSGEMSPATTVQFEAHLRACPDCTAFFNTYRETIRATRALPSATIPDELLSRVWQFLRRSI
jgi:hypothetical protein